MTFSTFKKDKQAVAERTEYLRLIRSTSKQYLPDRLARKYCRMMKENFTRESLTPTLNLKNMVHLSSIEELVKHSAMLFKLRTEWPSKQYEMSLYDKLDIVERLYEWLTNAKADRKAERNLLFKCSAVLSYKDSFECFNRLSPQLQSQIYIHSEGVSPDIVHCLVKMFNRTDLDFRMMILMIDQSYVDNFIDLFEGSLSKSSMKHELEPAPFSDKFCKLAYLDKPIDRYWRPNAPEGTLERFGYLRGTFLTLFRAYYGERVVLDLIEYFKDEGLVLSPRVMMSILDEWKTGKDYPIEWIVTTAQFSAI